MEAARKYGDRVSFVLAVPTFHARVAKNCRSRVGIEKG